jgi:hypothetical protein
MWLTICKDIAPVNLRNCAITEQIAELTKRESDVLERVGEPHRQMVRDPRYKARVPDTLESEEIAVL